MSHKQICTALIGAGYIADWHAEALKSVPEARLTAICDLSPGAAQALADRQGVQAFTSLDDLIAANVCDAVHILTPPPSHRDLTVACLEAGLHVLTEKPVALSSGEIADIAKAAAASGRMFAAGHNFLGLPSYQRLKALRATGQLGRITSAEVNWHLPLAPLRSGPFGLWLLREPKNLLLELGPHLVAFAQDLLGDMKVEHLSLGKPITLPGGAMRAQSWRILARAGEVDITFNISVVETMDDRSLILRGAGGVARLDYANDVLVVERENAADIVLNPFLRQMSLAGQHLREGLVNLNRQTLSLNRKSAYAQSFIGSFRAIYQALQTGGPMDPRFDLSAANAVTRTLEDVLAFLPEGGAETHPKPQPKRRPKPKVLVIGGTGFIGRHLTRALVADGQDVRVVSRGAYGPFDDLVDHVETIAVSLKDEAGLARAMTGIDTVYDLAKSMDDTWQACLENDVGVRLKIAKAALDQRVTRFIYTGTIASYDMSDGGKTITEATGFAADMSDRNLYARSKAACEAALIELHETEGLPLVIIRPGIVVGAGGPLQHWGIGRWHGAGKVRIWGNGRNLLPFVLIDDVCDGLIQAAKTPAAVGKSFNLVGEPMLTARDYFNAIDEAVGARIAVKSGWLPGFFLTDGVKHLLKRHVLRRTGLSRASLKDWQSRAHLSPFSIDQPKTVLGWTPESDRHAFVQKAITEANLFGF